MPNWSITIAGVQMVDAANSAHRKISRGTVSVTQAVGGRWNCSFRVLSLNGSYSPAVGAPVVVTYLGNRLYAGWIWSSQERMERGIPLKTYDIVCVDKNFACDRRPAGTRAWKDAAAGTIVTDICNTDLLGEGVGVTFVAAGPTISGQYEITGYPTVAEAFTGIAGRAKCYWYIDADNELRFFASDTAGYTAPFTAARANCAEISTYRSLEEYANKVILKLPQFMRAEETETWLGNGATTSFDVGYPIASKPVVTVNGAPQSVGIWGVDTGVQWYWNQGSTTVSQDGSGTPLTSAQTLAITYVGLSQVTVEKTADGTGGTTDQLSARAAIEGGSGLHVRVIEWGEQANREAADAKVAALLDTLDELPAVRVYRTNSILEPLLDAIKAGDQQVIDGTSFLIRSVKWSDDPSGDVLHLEAEGVRGPLLQDFAAMLKELAGGDQVPVGAPAGQTGGGSTPVVVNPAPVTGVSAVYEAFDIDGTKYFDVTVNYTSPTADPAWYYTAIDAAWVNPLAADTATVEEAWVEGVSKWERIRGERDSGPWLIQNIKAFDGGRRYLRVYACRRDDIWSSDTPTADIVGVVTYLAAREPLANGFDGARIRPLTAKDIPVVGASATPPALLSMHPTSYTEPYGVWHYLTDANGISEWYAYVKWQAETATAERSKLVFEYALANASWVPSHTPRPLGQVSLEAGGVDLPPQSYGAAASNALMFVWVESVDNKRAQCATLRFQIPASPVNSLNLGNAIPASLTLPKFGPGIEPYSVVSSLPLTFTTRLVVWTATGKTYRWNGIAYVETINATDLLANLANGITTAQFSSTIEAATLVATTPASKITGANVIYNTTTRQLLRWNGAAYSRTVNGADIKAELFVDKLTAGEISAGAVGTQQLTTGELLVGAGGGKPSRVRINDASGNQIGFWGDDGVGFIGSWASRGRFGGTFISPLIDLSSTGATITDAEFTLNTPTNLIKITKADSTLFSRAQTCIVNMSAGGSSKPYQTIIGSAGMTMAAGGYTGVELGCGTPGSPTGVLNLLSYGTQVISLAAGSGLVMGGILRANDYVAAVNSFRIRSGSFPYPETIVIDANKNIRWQSYDTDAEVLDGRATVARAQLLRADGTTVGWFPVFAY